MALEHTAVRADFARFAAGAGADVLMVLPPDWDASTTPDTLAEHYGAVAAHFPAMLVTGIFIPVWNSS